ncbi:DUF885 domain-containing protein [Sphingomonas profundi]|uniref:DUF885 domain-containing protein n=1 Tax=Alterirhizorhabdus profundi TaxID=2681549 RepID=UPI0012E96CC0|nr:DUF885 domain-containing protein [Sphingomonas profundi]
MGSMAGTGGSTRREAVAAIGGAGLAALLPPGPAPAAAPPPCPIRTPLDAIANRLLALTPEAGVYAGVPAALDGGPLARRMDDYSPEGEAMWRAALLGARADLTRIACAGDANAALDLATAGAVIDNAVRAADIPYGRINAFNFSGHVPYLVTQISGPMIDTPGTMQGQQSVSSPAAVDAWIAKLDGFPAGFAGVEAKLAADEAAGCRPPRVLLEGAREVIAAFLAGPAERHPLLLALREGMQAAGLDARLRDKALERATVSLQQRARPAYAALLGRVTAMVPRGRAEAGLWAQPRGDEFYAANVRSLGDTALGPAQIHRIGLAEVQRITARMERLLRLRGLSRGSVGARMDALAHDPRHLFADSDEGREELLDYLRGLVAKMEARYPEILPPALIPRQRLQVRRVPVATEAGAPGGYYDGPSLDGTRPGTYWINLRDMAAVARFRLPTLSYHEGVPGHHTQNAVALGLGEQPLLIRIASFNAYQEGWALYCERLAAEMGCYRTDPLGNLGRLQDELFRAVRLVVDTGLHFHRWSEARAVAYMRDATGVAESRVIAEVRRYMAWPGQALGYKLGQLRLLELRGRMMARRKRRFRRQDFHALVLSRGPMPLDLVARRIG